MPAIEKTIAERRVIVYPAAAANAPVVYAPMYEENGQAVLDACAAQGAAPFHLITLSNLHWEDDLSPWPCPPVFAKGDGFAGEAAAFTELLTTRVLPFTEEMLGAPPYRLLAGYSMAGLYALYAPFLTDAFSRLVCASGSVWFPDFVPYVEAHVYRRAPAAVYLSLGDREGRTKNLTLRTVDDCMGRLHAHFARQGIPTTLEWNPGNHYVDAAGRLARGIVWALGQGERQ